MAKLRKAALAAIACIAAVAVTSPVSAQGMGQGMGMGPGMGPVAKLCTKEIAAHCAQVQQGPALRTCLEAKSAELSENCRVAVELTGPDRTPGTGPVARLCMIEIDKFCAEVEHKNGQVRDCLEKRRSELGEACTAALDTTGMGRKK